MKGKTRVTIKVTTPYTRAWFSNSRRIVSISPALAANFHRSPGYKKGTVLWRTVPASSYRMMKPVYSVPLLRDRREGAEFCVRTRYPPRRSPERSVKRYPSGVETRHVSFPGDASVCDLWCKLHLWSPLSPEGGAKHP